MILRRLTALCLIAAVIFAVTGCGSSKKVSASAYVTSVCQAVGPFAKTLASRQAALNTSSVTTAAQGKQVIVTFLNTVVQVTDTALTKLKAAGVPDVKNGDQINSKIVGAFSRVSTLMKAAVKRANALPVTSKAAFASAGNSIAASVKSAMSGIDKGVQAVTSSDLAKATKDAAACQALSAG